MVGRFTVVASLFHFVLIAFGQEVDMRFAPAAEGRFDLITERVHPGVTLPSWRAFSAREECISTNAILLPLRPVITLTDADY